MTEAIKQEFTLECSPVSGNEDKQIKFGFIPKESKRVIPVKSQTKRFEDFGLNVTLFQDQNGEYHMELEESNLRSNKTPFFKNIVNDGVTTPMTEEQKAST